MSHINGDSLEKLTERAYQSLLDNENINNSNITRRKKLIGRSGVKHEFDIYYEIEIARITHKVVIECKDHSNKVTKGMVQEFKSKLDDCNNLIGIMISSNGYQSGAKDYAKHYGIKLLNIDDLPNVFEIIRMNIMPLLPDERTTGELFWVIMEVRNNKNTGNYVELHENTIVLFFSKKSAEKALKFTKENCKVFGVSKNHLRGICAISQVFGTNLCIYPLLSKHVKSKLEIMPYSYDDIINEFLKD